MKNEIAEFSLPNFKIYLDNIYNEEKDNLF